MEDVNTGYPNEPSSEQLKKIGKHITESTGYSVQSIFTSTEALDYADHIVNSQDPGVVEIDGLGRRDIIWFADRKIRRTFRYGDPDGGPLRGVVLVLSSDPGRAHKFPFDLRSLTRVPCGKCGKLVLQLPPEPEALTGHKYVV